MWDDRGRAPWHRYMCCMLSIYVTNYVCRVTVLTCWHSICSKAAVCLRFKSSCSFWHSLLRLIQWFPSHQFSFQSVRHACLAESLLPPLPQLLVCRPLLWSWKILHYCFFIRVFSLLAKYTGQPELGAAPALLQASLLLVLRIRVLLVQCVATISNLMSRSG